MLNRTIVLARRARNVFPNPRVGAVVVKRGKIIARGWHKKFGGPHAEIVALDALRKGERRGATVYVSMEPCADWKGKKTPSCAKRLARERVAAVIVGMRDPHPHVQGKGIAILKRAGVRVTVAPTLVDGKGFSQKKSIALQLLRREKQGAMDVAFYAVDLIL